MYQFQSYSPLQRFQTEVIKQEHTLWHILFITPIAVMHNARQKHLGCKKVWGQSEPKGLISAELEVAK